MESLYKHITNKLNSAVTMGVYYEEASGSLPYVVYTVLPIEKALDESSIEMTVVELDLFIDEASGLNIHTEADKIEVEFNDSVAKYEGKGFVFNKLKRLTLDTLLDDVERIQVRYEVKIY